MLSQKVILTCSFFTGVNPSNVQKSPLTVHQNMIANDQEQWVYEGFETGHDRRRSCFDELSGGISERYLGSLQ
jgi:hypothetical protein